MWTASVRPVYRGTQTAEHFIIDHTSDNDNDCVCALLMVELDLPDGSDSTLMDSCGYDLYPRFGRQAAQVRGSRDVNKRNRAIRSRCSYLSRRLAPSRNRVVSISGAEIVQFFDVDIL